MRKGQRPFLIPALVSWSALQHVSLLFLPKADRLYENERFAEVLTYCESLLGITIRFRGRGLFCRRHNSGQLAEHPAEHLDAALIQNAVFFDDL